MPLNIVQLHIKKKIAATGRAATFFLIFRLVFYAIGAGKLEIRISGGYPVDIRRISGGGISNFPAQALIYYYTLTKAKQMN